MVTDTRPANKIRAAHEKLWGPATPGERWNQHCDKLILFVARLGWATVELANSYLQRTKRDWSTRAIDENLLISKKAIVDDKIAHILVLTHKAQARARSLDEMVGRRINRENSHQARHDLIAAWVGVSMVNNCLQQKFAKDLIEIWADRPLRSIISDETVRPDISIVHRGKVLLNIEIERTRKTKPAEHFFFMKKLQDYQQKGIDVLVIFERTSQAEKFIDQLKLAEHFGLNRWITEPHTKKKIELCSTDREIFFLAPMIGVWDHQSKRMCQIKFYNHDQFESILADCELGQLVKA